MTVTTIVELLLATAKADTDLLLKNDALGDQFTVPRLVDFLLRASSAEQAQLVADFINDNRYGSAKATSENDEHRIAIFLEMPITQNVLCSVSGLMACISKVFKVEYDGWGCQPQTKPAALT